ANAALGRGAEFRRFHQHVPKALGVNLQVLHWLLASMPHAGILGVSRAGRQNLLTHIWASWRHHQSTRRSRARRIQAREACMRGGHDPRSLTMTFSYSRRDIVVAAYSAGLVVLAQPGIAAPISLKVDLSGAQQVPPVQTSATGKADLT